MNTPTAMENQLQLNPYDKEICQAVVKKFNELIKNKYGRFTQNDFRKFYEFDDTIHHRSTPRYGSVVGIIPCASFYYLNKLLEIESSEIADIGCGMNFFKEIIPGIIGFDGHGKDHDVEDLFDDVFSTKHANFFQCAFSIDSLHFIPITDFYDRVISFANIIKPNGRGYLAMNVARMVEFTDKKILNELFDTTNPNREQLSNYINQKIKMLPLNFLVIDILITEKYDEYMDGNIRLVFEKE